MTRASGAEIPGAILSTLPSRTRTSARTPSPPRPSNTVPPLISTAIGEPILAANGKAGEGGDDRERGGGEEERLAAVEGIEVAGREVADQRADADGDGR